MFTIKPLRTPRTQDQRFILIQDWTSKRGKSSRTTSPSPQFWCPSQSERNSNKSKPKASLKCSLLWLRGKSLCLLGNSLWCSLINSKECLNSDLNSNMALNNPMDSHAHRISIWEEVSLAHRDPTILTEEDSPTTKDHLTSSSTWDKGKDTKWDNPLILLESPSQLCTNKLCINNIDSLKPLSNNTNPNSNNTQTRCQWLSPNNSCLNKEY